MVLLRSRFVNVTGGGGVCGRVLLFCVYSRSPGIKPACVAGRVGVEFEGVIPKVIMLYIFLFLFIFIYTLPF